MPTFLKNLAPGTRVQVVGLPDTATLIRTNDCRAIVREDRLTAWTTGCE